MGWGEDWGVCNVKVPASVYIFITLLTRRISLTSRRIAYLASRYMPAATAAVVTENHIN